MPDRRHYTPRELRLLRDVRDGHIGLYGDPPTPDRTVPADLVDRLVAESLVSRTVGQGRTVWLPTADLDRLVDGGR